MKAGQIVESYGGKFAKIVRVSEDGGMFSLSAWVRSREAAEVETVADITLNDFGMSQVLKGGANVPNTTPEKGDGTKPLTEMKFADLKALAKSYGLSQKGKAPELVERLTAFLQTIVDTEMEDRVVTEEDLTANPGLADAGVKVGDTVKFPKEAE